MGCSTTKRVILTFFSNNFVKAEVTQSLAGRPPQRKEIAIGLNFASVIAASAAIFFEDNVLRPVSTIALFFGSRY